MVTDDDQLELSRETCCEAIPEMASVLDGVTMTAEVYQPFEPFGAAIENPAVGGVVSILMVWVEVPRLPATS
jgi:hypothetical protein